MLDKPPMEWVDKLFDCMSLFYGQKWDKRFETVMTRDMIKTVWQSAITGLSYDEIKRSLVLLRQDAQVLSSVPPSHVEFYCYAKFGLLFDKREEPRPKINNRYFRRNAPKPFTNMLGKTIYT